MSVLTSTTRQPLFACSLSLWALKCFQQLYFFASRNEDQITTVFRSAALSNITLYIPLDNNYLPENDIRVFLDDSFNELKRTHPFARLINKSWPATSDIQEIVKKSSGQFIYASVVFKFCAMLDHHPEQQLNIVRGFRPRGALTPFAQLDALYRHIFSQVQDLEEAIRILVFAMLSDSPTLDHCTEFLEMQTVDIYVALAPLQSVVDCRSDDKIQLLHASLPDFLLGQRTLSRILHQLFNLVYPLINNGFQVCDIKW